MRLSTDLADRASDEFSLPADGLDGAAALADAGAACELRGFLSPPGSGAGGSRMLGSLLPRAYDRFDAI
jgi:hypothetical protein